MKPSICRMVVFKGLNSNGAIEHPAVITRVWTDDCVNLTVFPDGATPMNFSSVMREGVLPQTYTWNFPTILPITNPTLQPDLRFIKDKETNE